MIGHLTGILLEKQAPHLLLDVMGVGYEIEVSLHTFAKMAEIGQKTNLYIHLQVREDAFLLYGFFDQDERSLFRNLLRVNGIGPKLALTILSHTTPDGLVCSVIDNDPARLQQIPGIGKKTAERLLIEMKDRVIHWQLQSNSMISETSHVPQHERTKQEAISALLSLGYKSQEAHQAITTAMKEGDGQCDAQLNSETLIRLALKAMAKK